MDQKHVKENIPKETPTGDFTFPSCKKIFAVAGGTLLLGGIAAAAFYADKHKDLLHQGFFFENGKTAGMFWTILVLVIFALAVGIHSRTNSKPATTDAPDPTSVQP